MFKIVTNDGSTRTPKHLPSPARRWRPAMSYFDWAERQAQHRTGPLQFCGVAQLEERSTHNREVAGSIPASATDWFSVLMIIGLPLCMLDSE